MKNGIRPPQAATAISPKNTANQSMTIVCDGAYGAVTGWGLCRWEARLSEERCELDLRLAGRDRLGTGVLAGRAWSAESFSVLGLSAAGRGGFADGSEPASISR